jgi:transposase
MFRLKTLNSDLKFCKSRTNRFGFVPNFIKNFYNRNKRAVHIAGGLAATGLAVGGTVMVMRKRKQKAAKAADTAAREAEGPTQDAINKAFKMLSLTEGTPDEIKKQYRKLALQFHPDKNKNVSEEQKKENAEKIRDINVARDVLVAAKLTKFGKRIKKGFKIR